MALEIAGANNRYIYRIDPMDPWTIQRREAKFGARWQHHRSYTSREIAHETLLKMGGGDTESGKREQGSDVL